MISGWYRRVFCLVKIINLLDKASLSAHKVRINAAYLTGD